MLQHVGRCALEDDFSSKASGFGSHVDYVVGLLHHVLVVFDDDDCVAFVSEVFEGRDELHVVSLVESDAGFVKHVEYVDEFGAYLCGEAYALAFASAQADG